MSHFTKETESRTNARLSGLGSFGGQATGKIKSRHLKEFDQSVSFFEVQASAVAPDARVVAAAAAFLLGGVHGHLRPVEHLARRLPPTQLREVRHFVDTFLPLLLPPSLFSSSVVRCHARNDLSAVSSPASRSAATAPPWTTSKSQIQLLHPFLRRSSIINKNKKN